MIRKRGSLPVGSVIAELLAEGRAVEIEGLGVFRPDTGHGIRFKPEIKPKVFIAYVDEDLAPARQLFSALRLAGFKPWLDKHRLLPGQNWPRSIEAAIGVSDFFVPCFSRRAAFKRGQFQCELRYALDCARRLPLEDIFIVPVRLDDCEVPRKVSDHLQYIDLFPDWNGGISRVCAAIRTQMEEKTRRLLLAG